MTISRAARAGLTAVLPLLLAGSALAQSHPWELPRLSADGPYPRCVPGELAAAGYPDHMHEWVWPTWQPLVGADGETYGPGAFCRRKTVLPREGLVLEADAKIWRHLVLRHNPGYADCDMLPFLELLDLADRTVHDLLGLAASDTLTVINPDNNNVYRQLTGQDVWRLYRRDGDEVVIEPIGVLQARTLDGHAAFMLTADWLLAQNGCGDLPAWLRHGLADYLAEYGVHLNNYMGEFRTAGQVLFSPPLVESILAAAPDPDRNRDREMYRRASYSAFLMVWELVENRGGMAAMRDFLARVSAGESADAAAVAVYGLDMSALARMLDPVQLGEPVGEALQSRRPHQQP